MLIAPTERPAPLLVLGKTSSKPERMGVDFAFVAQSQWCGVQRKEIKDLIASVHDGRIQREVAQMQTLHRRMLIVEGRLRWTMDGILIGDGFGRDWTIQMHQGILWSLQDRGIWVMSTEDPTGTAQAILNFERWCQKEKHTALSRRPGAFSAWGSPDNRDFGMHLLMGVDGIGPELAGAIYDHFGGVPWTWSVGKEDLMAIPGIGKVKADKLLGSLRTPPEQTKVTS